MEHAPDRCPHAWLSSVDDRPTLTPNSSLPGVAGPFPSDVPTAARMPHRTAPQKRGPAHLFVDLAIPFLLTALIREIDGPHCGAIHVQFEDIGSGVVPAHIELPA